MSEEVKDWEVEFQDYNENPIHTWRSDDKNYKGLTRREAEDKAKDDALQLKAHTFTLAEKQQERWIKSKIAIVLGINNQFAGMCLVENEEQIKKIREEYDFPYLVQIVDDIQTFEKFSKNKET